MATSRLSGSTLPGVRQVGADQRVRLLMRFARCKNSGEHHRVWWARLDVSRAGETCLSATSILWRVTLSVVLKLLVKIADRNLDTLRRFGGHGYRTRWTGRPLASCSDSGGFLGLKPVFRIPSQLSPSNYLRSRALRSVGLARFGMVPCSR